MKKTSIILSILTLIFIGIYHYTHTSPLVSVIMLTYNRANLVPYAIQSILNQTYQNFELIIINDASTDNTSDIISKYAKDPRIKIITNTTNKGIVYNRNLGIKLSQGKYISWLDDDDLAEKNKLEEQVKFLEKHQDITILGTQISLLGSQRMVHLWPTETDYKKTQYNF